MSEQATPKPNGICLQCQRSAPVMKHDPSGRLAVYCEHNRAGAVLCPAADGPVVWLIYTPVDRDEFVESIINFAERFRATFGSAGAPLQ